MAQSQQQEAPPAPADPPTVSEVYVWGADEYGQLGLGNQNRAKVYTIPRFCSFNVHIRMIACGEDHSAMIANAGYVYTMGSNAEGRLGIGNKNIPYSIKPYIVEALTFHRIKYISAGFAHSAAITDQGELYAWGLGETGALGVNTKDSLWSPMRVAFPDVPNAVIYRVSCGSKHTAIIDDKGRLYTCGTNDSGQLGTGHKRGELMPALITTINDRMVQISAGIAHTLVLTKTGRVFAMGSNSGGQLGTGSKRDSHYPLQVKDMEPFNVNKVSAGHHSAAVTDNGDLYIWGKGSFGEYSRPTRVAGMRVAIKDVNVGSYSGGAIDLEGNVWTWGANAKGQLGHGNYSNQDAPTLIEAILDKRIKELSIGGHFMLSLSRSEADQSTPYEGGSPLRQASPPPQPLKRDASASIKKSQSFQQKSASPMRMSKAELRESNSSVRFAPDSSPNRGRGGVGGPNAETPERYRRGATKSPSGGAPRPVLYKEAGSQHQSGILGSAKKDQRGRSKMQRAEEEAAPPREDSPAYKAAVARLNDVTRDKDQLEEDLNKETAEKEEVKEYLERTQAQLEHLRATSPTRGEVQRLNQENDMLRESIHHQDRAVNQLGGELNERNREIDFLRDRLSAIERDNKDIAERVAMEHEREMRQKHADMEGIRDQLRDAEARAATHREDCLTLDEKHRQAQGVADIERRAREQLEIEVRSLRALLDDEKTRVRALNDELAIAQHNQDSVAHDYSRDIERLKAEFEDRIAQKNEDLVSLRRALDDVKYEKDDLVARVGANSHEHEGLRKEILVWKDMVNRHVDENTELKKIIEDLEQKNRKLSESLDYYLYNRAADYKERTLQALQRNQELRARGASTDPLFSPGRLPLPSDRIGTRSALENITRMVGRGREDAYQIREQLGLKRDGDAPVSLTPHQGHSPAPGARGGAGGDGDVAAFDEGDSRLVRSNYSLVKDLAAAKTPLPERPRFTADESAITSGGRGRGPSSSPLRESSSSRRGAVLSRSPNRFITEAEKEAMRRSQRERNQDIDDRHARAVGSAQRMMNILEFSSPIKHREGLPKGLNVSPLRPDKPGISPMKQVGSARSLQGRGESFQTSPSKRV